MKTATMTPDFYDKCMSGILSMGAGDSIYNSDLCDELYFHFEAETNRYFEVAKFEAFAYDEEGNKVEVEDAQYYGLHKALEELMRERLEEANNITAEERLWA